MRIHREGRKSIVIIVVLWAGSVVAVIIGPFWEYLPVISGLLFIMMCLYLYFFRHPERRIEKESPQLVYSPADGKVVAIEEVYEHEYLKENRMQVSIFMSPLDVHVNRVPMSGKVIYRKHHPGKYLVAWHPKSSTDNEHVTYVLESDKHRILIRQIAGAVARRIVPFVDTGDEVRQGGELGFIKFGSRCDILLPAGTAITVNIGDIVKGNIDVIGQLP